MKWDHGHAADMMNLMALRESGQWDSYWQPKPGSQPDATKNGHIPLPPDVMALIPRSNGFGAD